MAEDIGRRARRLADGAVHASVTTSALLETVDDDGFLYGGPPIDHLEAGEQPHFLFHTEVKGVSTGTRFGGTKPDPDGGGVVVVTDRRVLGVVGRVDGDIEFAVPLEAVTAVDSATARTKGRLTVETDETRYHFWVHRTVSSEPLATAAAFVEAGGDPEAV